MGIVRRAFELIRAVIGRASRSLSASLVVPQGLTDEQFRWLSAQVRSHTRQLGEEIYIQGSRAGGTATQESDLDIAILVDAGRFEEILQRSFGNPKIGSAKERTMHHAGKTGKIQAGEAGLRPLRRKLEQELGLEIDISVIRRGGPFDSPPYLRLRWSDSEQTV